MAIPVPGAASALRASGHSFSAMLAPYQPPRQKHQPMARIYQDPLRALQDQFDTRRFADRLEAEDVMDRLDGHAQNFVSAASMFFLSRNQTAQHPARSGSGLTTCKETYRRPNWKVGRSRCQTTCKGWNAVNTEPAAGFTHPNQPTASRAGGWRSAQTQTCPNLRRKASLAALPPNRSTVLSLHIARQSASRTAWLR